MLRTHCTAVFASILVIAAALPLSGAHADVTTQQKTSFNLGGLMKMSLTSTDQISGDRQRRESETHCDGLMSMFCGKNKTAEIVRLDKSLEWDLKVDKKHYTEKPFPTAAEQAAFVQKMKDLMQKMKDCPNTAVPDKKCELSAPKLDVKTTDEHATIAGHDTKKTVVTMTQTSSCKESADVCEITYGFDSWLTADPLPGTEEQRAFVLSYVKQMGFGDESGVMKGQMSQFMGPYADMITQLRSKASALKGTALRTTFRMTMGGDKCGQAKQAKAGGAPDAAPSTGNVIATTAGGVAGGTAGTIIGGSVGGQLGQLGGKLLGGMFGKKKPDAPADAATAGGGTPAANVVTMVEFTTETVAIDTNAITASQFEIPAGYTRDEPKADTAKDEEFTCPATPGSPGAKASGKSGS